MNASMTKTREIERQMTILRKFVEVYCQKQHSVGARLCEQCRDLLDYAQERLEDCPYDPKPKCKDCTTHCYKKDYREQIRAIMRFSGMHFVKRGRLDWLIRYFLAGRKSVHGTKTSSTRKVAYDA